MGRPTEGDDKRVKRPPHPKPTCKICLRVIPPTEGTDEDAYPKWLRARIFEYFESLPRDTFVDPAWRPGRRDLLKKVCQDCQRQLNDGVEIPAKDLLVAMFEGKALELSTEQQTILARWFIKTSIVISLCPAQDGQNGPQNPMRWRVDNALRARLYRMLSDGTPPPDATVRVAYFSEQGGRPGKRYLPDATPRDLDFINVLPFPWVVSETVISFGPLLGIFVHVTEGDDRFLRLWPPSDEPAVWPPRTILHPIAGNDLRDDWGPPAKKMGNFPKPLVPAPERADDGD